MSPHTQTINLRKVPYELVKLSKACAALQDLTLKDFILRAMKDAVARQCFHLCDGDVCHRLKNTSIGR